MKTIAICNLKGGVAKTTTTVNLAALLARAHGMRVLVIDADSQANTTRFFANAEFGARNPETLADLLRMPKTERTDFSVSFNLQAVIRPSSFPGVDLLPADSTLMDLDLSKVESDEVFTQVLSRGLPVFRRAYDFVLIDCPPAFNAASAAALLAADAVLIPIKIDAFALEGMANLMQQIVNMRKINPRLLVLGLLPVMWYRSPAVGRAELALRDSGLRIFPHIRRSDKVDDMTFRQEPLCLCSPKSGAAHDYKTLAALIAGSGDAESAFENSEFGIRKGAAAMREFLPRDELVKEFQNSVEPLIALLNGEITAAVRDADVIRFLSTFPAADVRPVVRGKWKLGGYSQISDATVKWYDQFLQGGFLYCSACKERSSVKTNFCPNCGADLREGGAENG